MLFAKKIPNEDWINKHICTISSVSDCKEELYIFYKTCLSNVYQKFVNFGQFWKENSQLLFWNSVYVIFFLLILSCIVSVNCVIG